MIKRNTQVSVYTQLSNKYNVPYQVIEVICNHPFLFASNAIKSDTDCKDIMFTYLGKLKIKNRYKKYYNKDETERTIDRDTKD